MCIYLARRAVFSGALVPLDVLVDGQKVAVLRRGERIQVQLPDHGAKLQVVMQQFTRSPVVHIAPSDQGTTFDCGTPLWLLIDFFSLAYLPGLRDRVFYLRKSRGTAALEP